jgi:hypothetical protein
MIVWARTLTSTRPSSYPLPRETIVAEITRPSLSNSVTISPRAELVEDMVTFGATVYPNPGSTIVTLLIFPFSARHSNSALT